MIFAKIDFINLLPFHVYSKRYIRSNQYKAIIRYKKSYPSDINRKFKKRKIDAAFISSIASKNCKSCLDIGIVADGEVDSVFVIPKENHKKDFQSETSNALAQILKIDGEVIIGDKALYKFYNSDEELIDLSLKWKEKTNLPFVFARLCVNKHHKYLYKLTSKFLNTKVYIPQYILEKYSSRSGVSKKQILNYLENISYKIESKEKQSLKLFLRLSKNIKEK